MIDRHLLRKDIAGPWGVVRGEWGKSLSLSNFYVQFMS